MPLEMILRKFRITRRVSSWQWQIADDGRTATLVISFPPQEK